MSLLNPVVTCGYVNTAYAVFYVINKTFFLRMHLSACILAVYLIFLFHAFCAFAYLYYII